MTDTGKRLRELEEAGLISNLTDIAYNPAEHRLRHIVHLVGGHTGGILSLAVTPDGRHLVTGSLDHTAKLWDLETGRCLQTFTGHTDEPPRFFRRVVYVSPAVICSSHYI